MRRLTIAAAVAVVLAGLTPWLILARSIDNALHADWDDGFDTDLPDTY